MVRSHFLPDISVRYNTYTTALLSAINDSKRDWKLISFYIHSLNTLLTSKYTIPIVPQHEYDKEKLIMQTRTCQFCLSKDFKIKEDDEGNKSKEWFEVQSKIPVKDIDVFEELESQIIQFFILKESNYARKTRRKWNCPLCKQVNLVSETPVSDVQYGSNATFGKMYEIPVLLGAKLINKNATEFASMTWVTDYLREIDMGLMAFQKTYFEQHGTEMSQTISPFQHEDKK